MAEQIRVMVVDDHPMWRDGVARDLGARGFDVLATADGWTPPSASPEPFAPTWS
jgi:DNA-binding response OmpR family regulator